MHQGACARDPACAHAITPPRHGKHRSRVSPPSPWWRTSRTHAHTLMGDSSSPQTEYVIAMALLSSGVQAQSQQSPGSAAR